MAPSKFHDLAVHRLAVSLADDMHRAVARWPAFDRSSLGLQLVRAADSVGANIAEAAGRWHLADKRRLLIPGTRVRAEEIARALNGLIKKPT